LQRIIDAQQRKLKKGQSAIVETRSFMLRWRGRRANRVVVSLMATLK